MPGFCVECLDDYLDSSDEHIPALLLECHEFLMSQKLQGPDQPEQPDQVAGVLTMPEQALSDCGVLFRLDQVVGVLVRL